MPVKKGLPSWLMNGQSLVVSATKPRASCDASDSNPTTPKRTPEEQEILDQVAASRGEGFAAEYAELILEQARIIGDLPRAS